MIDLFLEVKLFTCICTSEINISRLFFQSRQWPWVFMYVGPFEIVSEISPDNHARKKNMKNLIGPQQ